MEQKLKELDGAIAMVRTSQRSPHFQIKKALEILRDIVASAEYQMNEETEAACEKVAEEIVEEVRVEPSVDSLSGLEALEAALKAKE
jgi:hypothetical protein